MATIPGTKFAEGAPPASTGQTTLNVPTSGGGEQQIAAGIGKAGSALFNYALNVERKKMVAEVSMRKRMIDEKGWLARESVIGDDEADGKLMETLEAEFNQIKSSSEYVDVNETMGLYVNDVLPNWQHGLKMQSKGIQSANADAQIEFEAQRLLELGDIDGFNETIDNAARLSPQKREYYENLKKEAPTQSVLAMAQRKLVEGDGKSAQAILDKLKDDDATTKQLDEKSVLEYNIKKLNVGKENDVEMNARMLAIEGKWQEGIDKINEALPELGADWHTNALNKFRNAFNILNETGVNVYTTTQNWSLYTDHRRRAASKSISEQEVIDSVGPDGYSWTQAEHLISIVNGKSSSAKAFEDSAAAKNLTELINYEVDIDPKSEAGLYQFTENKALGLLEDWVNEHPDATDTDKKVQALRISRDIKRDKDSGSLGRELEARLKPYHGLDIKKLEGLDRELTVETKKSKYKAGDTINKGGKKWKVVDFDSDGTPLVEEI